MLSYSVPHLTEIKYNFDILMIQFAFLWQKDLSALFKSSLFATGSKNMDTHFNLTINIHILAALVFKINRQHNKTLLIIHLSKCWFNLNLNAGLFKFYMPFIFYMSSEVTATSRCR